MVLAPVIDAIISKELREVITIPRPSLPLLAANIQCVRAEFTPATAQNALPAMAVPPMLMAIISAVFVLVEVRPVEPTLLGPLSVTAT